LNQNRELDKLRKKLPEKLQTGWWDEMGKG
jgi:hypothetical protein